MGDALGRGARPPILPIGLGCCGMVDHVHDDFDRPICHVVILPKRPVATVLLVGSGVEQA